MVLLIGAGAVSALVHQARSNAEDEARTQALAVAETFARSPSVLGALRSAHPSATLQPLAEATRQRAHVSYIVVTNPEGIRYSHPDPHMIGRHVNATLWPATAGRAFTDKVVGKSLKNEPSIRAVAPVTDAKGAVVGTVMAGVPIASVARRVDRQLPVLLASTGGALGLAAGGITWIGRRLRRQTHGLGPAEVTRMYEHHDAVLHAVREGVLIVNSEGCLVLANDEARRLISLPRDAQGRHIDDLPLGPSLGPLLASGRAATDEVHPCGDRLLAVNQQPTQWDGRALGTVTTLRDTTELRALAGAAVMARERLSLLHDAGLSIGTTLDVTTTVEELVAATVPRFAAHACVDLMDSVLRGEEPPDDSGEPLRRAATDAGTAHLAFHAAGDLVPLSLSSPQARALAEGTAVREPAAAGPQDSGTGAVPALPGTSGAPTHSVLAVPLRARGTMLGVVSFFRTVAPALSPGAPFDAEDAALAEEMVNHTAVCIDNARRYAREHATAVSLQRSLLPRELPEQGAVETAYCYLPGQTAVGGSWFDVIRLSGARVALVSGDVAGHGLHAAAAMGRLRTAVHNFSDLDLSPDELLAHLDDLVVRLDEEEERQLQEGPSRSGPAEDARLTGATCLYMVYDPAGRQCTMARAGHPLPALVRPDGTVDFIEVPGAPSLGGGGQPFESRTVDIAEHSQFVLYTDGLIKHAHPSPESGPERLRQVLARAGRSPQETCQAVLAAFAPDRLGRPAEDIALLVAGTRALDGERFADWEVPADPAAVSDSRVTVQRLLSDWGLDEAAFTTELILSELITNAIRYGTPPVQVRLLRDRSLICEVADASNTSPHVRRAAITDEGGRGLFLVAQLSRRWGCRYTSRGKVIWAEQTLPHEETAPAAVPEKSHL